MYDRIPEEIATAVRPGPRLLVRVGVFLLVVPPFPNCPSELSPQHETWPVSRMAQVWYSPDEIATAVRPVPRLLVSVGIDLSDVPPVPNWPLTPSPQHATSPLSRIAQVCAAPEEIATAVRPMPRLLVRVGVPLLDVSPLPNWPLEPSPA